MKEKNKKKAKRAVAAVPIIAAGSIAAIAAYKAGSNYIPSGENRKLQSNQVVFSQDNNRIGQKGQQKDESQMWERDNDSTDQGGNNLQRQSEYWFEDNLMKQQSTMLHTDTASASSSQYNLPDTGSTDNIFDLTGDRSQADMAIGGNIIGMGTGGDGTASGNGTGNGSQSMGNQNNNGNSNSNSGANSNGGNGSGNDNSDNGTAAETKPDDPDSKKSGMVMGGVIPTKPFDEKNETYTDENGKTLIYIGKSTDISGSMLYKGQSVTPRIIYNSLDTMVMGADKSWYLWGDTALDKYIRIDSVSFDGGTAWFSQFPVTIPKDIGKDQMIIKISWRLSESSGKWNTQEISYEPEANRIFVLSEKIKKGSSKIDENTILNTDKQHPEEGSTLNLYRYQWNLLGKQPLSALFPGWTEDGKKVSWIYKAGEGRHILEPSELVPLSNRYSVQLKVYWMREDGTIDPDASDLVYLQTLTAYNPSGGQNDSSLCGWIQKLWSHRVVVPKYVQAIDINASEGLEADILEIPDTVMSVKNQDGSLRVNNKYIVDKDNQWYASTEDGILMDKEETEILGIPYKMKKISVPENITKVSVGEENQLKELIFEETDLDHLPQITLQNLQNCHVTVDENILETFLKENRTFFTAASGNTVSSAQNRDVSYFVENSGMISTDGTLRKVFTAGNTSVVLSDYVKSVGKSALANVADASILQLPQTGRKVTLEKDCLAGSGIQIIRCFSEKQYDEALKDLEQAGGRDDITVELASVSKEGYYYSMSEKDGVQKAILISAPSDITSFDGTVTAEDGIPISITEIGDQAFVGCNDLVWADLPESVTKIGGQAFLNCKGLEGILIENKEQITIGDHAFDGCDAMRFIGSNAMQAVMENDYDPMVTDSYGSGNNRNNFFYSPTGSVGYGSHAIQFSDASGVEGYTLVDIGEGSMMLYGLDSDGTPWIGLRSCSIVPEEVHLPEFTMELFSYAMAGTHSVAARYTIDFENMWTLWAFDEGCFQDSMISGDIVLASDSYVDNNAFNGCPCITSVTLPGEEIFLGETVFQNCTNLKSATIGGLADNSMLEIGLFTNANALTDVTFTSWFPDQLMIYPKSEFRFNAMWTMEEEEEKLRIHVPEGQELTYIKAWRYGSVGYGSDPYSDSPYLEMWNDIQFSNIDWDNWEFPENSVVDALTKQRLLEAENHLRKLFDMEPVTEPTDYYPYRVNDGTVTMVDAPSYLEYLDMDYADFDLPDEWYFDYIGTGALADCVNLQYMKVADNLTGIYSNVFGEVKDSLTLEFTSPTPVKLLTDIEGETFYFGPDEDKMHIVVPEGWEEIYLNMWKYQMAGYENYDSMHDAIYYEMIDWDAIDWDTVDWDELMQPSEEQEKEIQAEMQKRLEPVVARLQKLLGMSSEETETDQTALPVR